MSSADSHRLYIPVRLNNWLIEPLLKGLRKRIARLCSKYELFPALDICCGAGRQCSLARVDRKIMIGLDKNIRILEYSKSRQPDLGFVCADASRLPFKVSSFKGILFSFSLHDKPPDLRSLMIAEAKRVLVPDGKLILLDFEPPWNLRSRLGWLLTTSVERSAGKEHFRNGREFLREGGLGKFIERNGLVELRRYPIDEGNSAIVVSAFSR
jgi:ubiquinone/menaquinone biosynthesis C-methylase UbiE